MRKFFKFLWWELAPIGTALIIFGYFSIAPFALEVGEFVTRLGFALLLFKVAYNILHTRW